MEENINVCNTKVDQVKGQFMFTGHLTTANLAQR